MMAGDCDAPERWRSTRQRAFHRLRDSRWWSPCPRSRSAPHGGAQPRRLPSYLGWPTTGPADDHLTLKMRMATASGHVDWVRWTREADLAPPPVRPRSCRRAGEMLLPDASWPKDGTARSRRAWSPEPSAGGPQRKGVSLERVPREKLNDVMLDGHGEERARPSQICEAVTADNLVRRLARAFAQVARHGHDGVTPLSAPRSAVAQMLCHATPGRMPPVVLRVWQELVASVNERPSWEPVLWEDLAPALDRLLAASELGQTAHFREQSRTPPRPQTPQACSVPFYVKPLLGPAASNPRMLDVNGPSPGLWSEVQTNRREVRRERSKVSPRLKIVKHEEELLRALLAVPTPSSDLRNSRELLTAVNTVSRGGLPAEPGLQHSPLRSRGIQCGGVGSELGNEGESSASSATLALRCEHASGADVAHSEGALPSSECAQRLQESMQVVSSRLQRLKLETRSAIAALSEEVPPLESSVSRESSVCGVCCQTTESCPVCGKRVALPMNVPA